MNAKMRAQLPFPEAWRRAAGAEAFKPVTEAYRAAQNVLTLPLEMIMPPRRARGGTGLGEEPSIALLKAFVFGQTLPPIEVARAKSKPRKFVVIDGYHRYYLSLAVGFSEIPVVISAGRM